MALKQCKQIYFFSYNFEVCYKGYAPSVKEEMSQLIICLLSVVSVKLFGLLLYKPLNPTFDWGESALDEKFKLWYKTIFFLQNFFPSEFGPIFILQHIWKVRNKALFDMLIQMSLFMLQRASLFIKNLWVLKGKPLKKRSKSLSFLLMQLLVFFMVPQRKGTVDVEWRWN